MSFKFIIAVILIISRMILCCESTIILNCSVKSQTPIHPLSIEVYTTLKTEICSISSVTTSETSLQRTIYNNDVLDFDLCQIDGNELSADIFISDTNKLTSIMSLTIGNQTTKSMRLFIKEGTLFLENIIDFLSIELNEVKLELNNNSMNNQKREYKTLSFVDFTVDNKNNYIYVNNDNNLSTTDGTIEAMDFDTLVGTVMGMITLVILVILFCWKFQNT